MRTAMKQFCGLAMISLGLTSGCCFPSDVEVGGYAEPTQEVKTQMQKYQAQAKTQLPNAER